MNTTTNQTTTIDMMTDAYAHHSAFFLAMAILTLPEEEVVPMLQAAEDEWAEAFCNGDPVGTHIDLPSVLDMTMKVLSAAYHDTESPDGTVNGTGVGEHIIRQAEQKGLGHLMLIQKTLH